jgi:hypothetical protein
MIPACHGHAVWMLIASWKPCSSAIFSKPGTSMRAWLSPTRTTLGPSPLTTMQSSGVVQLCSGPQSLETFS